MLNEDYKEMLQCLVEENARFLLVGAYAMAAHGYPRATMEIDIWVDSTRENARVVYRALGRFGAPLYNLTLADLEKVDTIFQIGVAPRRIDILTGVSGLQFEEAYRNSSETEIEGMVIRVLSLEDLIRNKRSTGRTKDRADAEALESLSG